MLIRIAPFIPRTCGPALLLLLLACLSMTAPAVIPIGDMAAAWAGPRGRPAPRPDFQRWVYPDEHAWRRRYQEGGPYHLPDPPKPLEPRARHQDRLHSLDSPGMSRETSRAILDKTLRDQALRDAISADPNLVDFCSYNEGKPICRNPPSRLIRPFPEEGIDWQKLRSR